MSSEAFYKENNLLGSLRIVSAIGIIIGTWSLLFEIYFFREFSLGIYAARILFTFVALFVFWFSFKNLSSKIAVLLTHFFLVSMITSFIVTIYIQPKTVFINSQILSVLIFTSAIIFNWDTKDQIIAAIYYNILFAGSILLNDSNIYLLPNIFSLVLFVSLISFISVAASFVNHKLRSHLAEEKRAREEAQENFMKEIIENEKIAQKALAEKKQKIELLAKINHEVRTPISAILMYFEMLEDGSMRTPEEMRNYSKTIKISSQRLLNTINNFVDYAKIESGKLEIYNDLFNLNEEVENTIQLLQPLATNKNNELILINKNTESPLVFSDAGKYRQILVNLIANAIKFTKEGKITVTYETLHLSDNLYNVVTSVEDTGPGIPEDKLESVFNPFVSLKNGDRVNFSSGLGLTIVKDFLHMFGGDIKLQSKVGVGSTFTFRIPFEYNFEKSKRHSVIA